MSSINIPKLFFLYLQKLKSYLHLLRYKKEYEKGVRSSRQPGIEFLPFSKHNLTSQEIEKVKHIALYLTQFHQTAENNKWWGKNFTEWNNVVKTKPQFENHHQPQLPHDIGFYNLTDKNTWKDQIEMAKNFGIYGFCFYFYWFNGQRLLEKPLDLFLQNKDLNMPFCLFWANDSWVRTWHGFSDNIKDSETSTLVKQNHNEKDDEDFIIHLLENYFTDERYIRINGKPLLIIYHTAIFPDITITVSRWREIAARKNEKLFLMYVLMPDQVSEKLIKGFDAAMQFSPIGCLKKEVAINKLNTNFQGKVYSYSDLVNSEIARNFNIPIARGCFPTWDNEARRPTKGISYAGSSALQFEKYLHSMSEYSINHPLENESIVFLNAWNEWAEGAHLEPDREFGYTWLEVIKNVIKERAQSN